MKLMTRLRWLLVILASLGLLVALVSGGGQALAATVAAMLSGSSSEGTKLDGIEVLSWSQGVTTAREAGSGLATGRRQYQPLLIRKRIDKASPMLHRALVQDETFTSLRLTIQDQQSSSGKSSPTTVTLTNAKVTAIATGDVDGDGVIDESVTFSYQKIEWSVAGVAFTEEWTDPPAPPSPPILAMAINEKGLPGGSTPKKPAKVSAYRTQITSPRDAASGLPTGKRQHSPFVLVVPGSGETPELTQSFLTGKPLDMVTVITYGSDGQPTGAVSLLGVQVVSMNETRRSWVLPHVLESSGRLLEHSGRLLESNDAPVAGSLRAAAPSETGMECVYELTYQKIQWLNKDGGVTHEDTWDQQR